MIKSAVPADAIDADPSTVDAAISSGQAHRGVVELGAPTRPPSDLGTDAMTFQEATTGIQLNVLGRIEPSTVKTQNKT